MRGAVYILAWFSAVATQAATWVNRSNIPEPTWGITNTSSMYSAVGATYDYGSGLESYRTEASVGPYTHWVDPDHGSATDSGNPTGSPLVPRKSWPHTLPAGSVVVIKGNIREADYQADSGKRWLRSFASPSNPTFFKGVSVSGNKPAVTNILQLLGRYIVIENISFTNATGYIDCSPHLHAGADNQEFIAIRDCYFNHGPDIERNKAGIANLGGWTLALSHQGANTANPRVWTRDICIYNNTFEYSGNMGLPPDQEPDNLGVEVNGFAVQRIWIIDNLMRFIAGDGIRIGSNKDGANVADGLQVFVAQNTIYGNRENCIDVKQLNDSVIAANLLHSNTNVTVTAGGEAVGVHLNPANIWFINNTVSNSVVGITCTEIVDRLVMLGNLFYYTKNAFEFWGDGSADVVGNTFYGYDSGVHRNGSGLSGRNFYNNIFWNRTNSGGGWHISIEESTCAAASVAENNVFDPVSFRMRWGSAGTTYTTLDAWKTASGKCVTCSATDPQFTNAATADFRLLTASPARSYGSASVVNSLKADYLLTFGVPLRYDQGDAEIFTGDGPEPGAFEMADVRVIGVGAGTLKSSLITRDFLQQSTVTNAYSKIDMATTKGDMIVRGDGSSARLGVGAANQVLTVDAAAPFGVKWADNINASYLTAKGDVLGHDGTSAVRVPVTGSDGYVLVKDAASAAGIKWAANANGQDLPAGVFGSTVIYDGDAWVSFDPSIHEYWYDSHDSTASVVLYSPAHSGGSYGYVAGYGRNAGLLYVSTGNAAGNYGGARRGAGNKLSNGRWILGAVIIMPPSLSTSGEHYFVQFGFADANNPASWGTQAAFYYSNDLNSGKWACRVGNGTSADADSGVTVTADGVYKMEVDLAQAAAKFRVNGTQVANVTSLVPGTNTVMYKYLQIRKDVGNSERIVYSDKEWFFGK